MKILEKVMRGYGISYKGSKNRIAASLIKVLPPAKRFVDLFGGGGAVTHVAALSGKYESCLYNDLQENVCKLIKEAVEGKYDDYYHRFIAREEFYQRKESDAYVKYVWSFGSNGLDYIFRREVEDSKYSIHNYIVGMIRDEFLRKELPSVILESEGLDKRQSEWCHKVREVSDCSRTKYDQLQELTACRRLTCVSGLRNISFTSGDYREYKHLDGDLVYCDPPYEKARGYGIKFDSQAFYEWVSTRNYPVYFSSYDNVTDEKLTKVWSVPKRNLARGSTVYDMVNETLYGNEIAKEQFQDYNAEREYQITLL